MSTSAITLINILANMIMDGNEIYLRQTLVEKTSAASFCFWANQCTAFVIWAHIVVACVTSLTAAWHNPFYFPSVVDKHDFAPNHRKKGTSTPFNSTTTNYSSRSWSPERYSHSQWRANLVSVTWSMLISPYTLPFKCLKSVRFFIFLRELILLFNRDALNWSKVTVKTFIMLQKISISNTCWWTFFLYYNKQHNCFQHCHSSEMFLEHQIRILEWFLKNHVTLNTVVMTA